MTRKNRFIIGLYALCISVLAFYIWQRNQEKNAQKAQYFRFSQTLGQLYEKVDSKIITQERAIKKVAMDYPCSYNSDLLLKSISIGKWSGRQKEFGDMKLMTNLARSESIPEIPNMNPVLESEVDKNEFFKKRHDFADSICTIFSKDSSEYRTIDNFFSIENQDIAHRILSSKHPDQQALLFQLSELERAIVNTKMLGIFQKAIESGVNNFKADGLIPTIIFNTDLLRVRKRILGEVMVESYITEEDKMGCTINGKAVPMQKGIAKYCVVAQQPGVVSFVATMSLINPVTGYTELFSSDFSFRVY